jgi:hypothetical protein
VVFIIANIVSPGHSLSYWLVVILGNLFVIGFEGMIVGIQTLRLWSTTNFRQVLCRRRSAVSSALVGFPVSSANLEYAVAPIL